MSRKTSVLVSGNCPTTGATQDITVEYISAQTIGTSSEQWIKGLFSCEIGSFGKCKVVNECPVFKKAPLAPKV